MDIDDGNGVGQVQGDDTPGPNPAWNDALSVIPEQFHSQVTPIFQQWDSAAQQKIESVNKALQDFEEYKPFVEHGISAQELEQGIRLMYELNNNPQNVYEALAKAYNFGGDGLSSETEGDGDDSEDSADDPRYAELQNHLELVSQIVLNDAQAKQAAQADMELDKELEDLKSQYGDYDERYVLALMQNGMSGEEAVQSFIELKNSMSPKSFAPNILGGGSSSGAGLPSNAIDPTKWSPKETRQAVVEMLKASRQQG